MNNLKEWVTLPYIRVFMLQVGTSYSSDKELDGKDLIPVTFLVYVLSLIIVQTLTIEGDIAFQWWDLQLLAVRLFLLGCFIYFLSNVAFSGKNSLLIVSIIFEIWTVLYCLKSLVLYFVNDRLPPGFVIFIESYFFSVELALLYSVFFSVGKSSLYLAKNCAIAYVMIFIVPQALFGHSDIVLVRKVYDDERNKLWEVKHDNLFYSQDSLIEEELSKIEQGTQGKKELFYLNVASYASQDVFFNEITNIQNLFREDFAGYARGINLVNAEDTYETTPLAIRRNIRLSLNGLAQKMNQEDILFLYLTSHGGKDHKFSISFFPFKLTDLDAEYLKDALDESKIRWKVIVISACYSGGMLDKLKDDDSIIFTAASSTKTSFGCANGREFTYFGEAIFKDNMTASKNIITAFEDAIEIVNKREAQEALESSEPQLWIGENIRNYIKDLKFE